MPKKQIIERVRRDKREGKSASTQAGEFVREEMEHIRSGKHGARSTKQAIAIGLSKARRAGVKLRPPRQGQASAQTRRQASRAYRAGQKRPASKPSARGWGAVSRALRRERHTAASRRALARQARQAARKRSHRARSTAAKRAARTRRSEHAG